MECRKIKAKEVKPGMMVRVIDKVATGVDAISTYDENHIEFKLKDASMIVGKEDLLWVVE